MAEQSSGKTTGKTPVAKKETVATATPAPTGSTAVQSERPAPTQTAQTAPAAQPPRPLPDPSPRNGVRVNLTSIQYAFTTGTRSRSVVAIQYALKDRGFDPGTPTGLVDTKTRAAYAEYQRTIDERATGLPTGESLEHLGFEVVG